jgi:hypothetical protein
VGCGAEGQRIGQLGFRRSGGGLAGGCVHAGWLSRFRRAQDVRGTRSPRFAHTLNYLFG